MNDKNDSNNSKSTLTLKPASLQLKTNDPSKIKQSFAHGRTKTVTVEVKKNRSNVIQEKQNRSFNNHRKSIGNDQRSLTDEEKSSRLLALNASIAQYEAEEKTKQINIELEKERLIKEAEELSKLSEKISDSKDNIPDPENIIQAQVSAEKSKEKQEAKNIIKETSKTSNINIDNSSYKNKSPDSEDNEYNKLSKKNVKDEVKVGSAKSKWEEGRRNSGKISINSVLEKENERTRSLAALKRARAKAKRGSIDTNKEKRIREITLPEIITVQELANRMAERGADVVKELMKMGILATGIQTIDADTAEIIADIFGHKVKRVTDSDVENVMIEEIDSENSLSIRPPVVTIMGHVDHGKTSLLDALRSTDIAAGEAGGITQHIGAYQITLEDQSHITFLDTPGHEAFTAMRARGAKATDIVVLVVAADDGIMAQTIEAINHAKAASVPIIVAINKVDKPEIDVKRVKEELLSHDLVAEEYGGEVIIVEVSAKTRFNLDKLEEAILLQAEMLNLRANPNRKASGIVIESKIDKNKGVVATILVQNGTLKSGDLIVAGTSYGKIKTINNDKGKSLSLATASMPVEILGLSTAPVAGESFGVISTEKQARDITEFRIKRDKDLKTTSQKKSNIEELFSKNIKIKELPIIIRADVQGSLEAIIGSIKKFTNDEVGLKVLHQGVGSINESDIALAKASNAMVIGFNVRASNNAKENAFKDSIDLRYYSIIYDLTDDIKAVLSGMLSPIIREEYLGSVVIRQIFNITKVGKVAGSFVTKGIVKRGSKVRLLRDNVVIHEGKLKTLRRFKEEAKEVRENFECGIAFENYEDIRENDVIEAFEIVEEKKSL